MAARWVGADRDWFWGVAPPWRVSAAAVLLGNVRGASCASVDGRIEWIAWPTGWRPSARWGSCRVGFRVHCVGSSRSSCSRHSEASCFQSVCDIYTWWSRFLRPPWRSSCFETAHRLRHHVADVGPGAHVGGVVPDRARRGTPDAEPAARRRCRSRAPLMSASAVVPIRDAWRDNTIACSPSAGFALCAHGSGCLNRPGVGGGS